jgi:hypothetical protein
MTQRDGWASSRVGWTIPATQTNSVRIEHPISRRVGIDVPRFSHLSVEPGSLSFMR